MCNREVLRRLFFLTMLITSEVPARNRVDQMLPTTGGKVILQCHNRHDLQVKDWFRLRTLKKEDGGRLLKATANRLITVQGRTKMKRKMIVVGCMMMLALMTVVGQPEKVQASGRVYVGVDLGGVFMPYNGYTRHADYRPPPDYYDGDRWHRVPPPCPPRGWYRHQPPPPVYFQEYRRPHHQNRYWHRDRW